MRNTISHKPTQQKPDLSHQARAIARRSVLAAAFVFVAPAACLFASKAFAQAPAAATGIEGTWQGTLHVPDGPQLRTVIKIAKGDDGKLKSTFYSIDQGGGSIGADKTTFTNGELTISIERLNLTYTGKMSADGKSIAGEANQGKPLPLLLERSTPATEWTIPEPPKPIPPMDPKADPGVEVATIKPTKPDEKGKGFGFRSGKIITVNFSLGELICTTYGIQAKQIIGAPDWIWMEKYDISGQPDTPGLPARDQLYGMFKKLMADRFQLKFHKDKKELSALILSPAKGGTKLAANPGDPTARPGLFFTGVGQLRLSNVNMIDFTHFLQSAILDRPVVDQTGLKGEYNFSLKWMPDEAQLAQMGMKAPLPSAEPADALPNLFTALQEQAGLKLESGKAPVEVYVIDKVEKPSEN